MTPKRSTRDRAARCWALIQIAMGGQCAEEIFFGDVSTGPGGDLLYATNVAAEMVGSCGMVDSLISFAAVQNSALNDSNIVGRVLADPAGRAAVEDLLQQQKVIAKGLLESNSHLVEALRDALLEREELIGREITDVLVAAQARPGHRSARCRKTEVQAPRCRTRSPTARRLQIVTRLADGLSVESLTSSQDAGREASEDDAVPIGGGHPALCRGSLRGRHGERCRSGAGPGSDTDPGRPDVAVRRRQLAGRVLPVIDLRPLVGAALSPLPTSARLVVLAEADIEVGIVADMVPGCSIATPRDLEPVPATIATGIAPLVRGVVDVDGPVALWRPTLSCGCASSFLPPAEQPAELRNSHEQAWNRQAEVSYVTDSQRVPSGLVDAQERRDPSALGSRWTSASEILCTAASTSAQRR